MFNYRITLSNEMVSKINGFTVTIRECASRSCEVTTEKKRLEAIRDNTDNTKEVQDEAIKNLEKLEEEWKKERKAYDLKLYGGKDKDGKKVGGYCDNISKDFYKAYVAYITECDNKAMYNAVADFLVANCKKGDVRDRAIQEFTTEILIILGGKFNSNSKLAKGEAFITTLNKRTFKKVLFGAIIDIIAKTTIKVG